LSGAGLGSDSPISASHVSGIIGVNHQVQPLQQVSLEKKISSLISILLSSVRNLAATF
jgi:hypothetical protein